MTDGRERRQGAGPQVTCKALRKPEESWTLNLESGKGGDDITSDTQRLKNTLSLTLFRDK